MYLTQALHRALARHPGRLATVFGKRKMDYSQFVGSVAKLASVFSQRLALSRGDRVAILSLNSDRFIQCFFGCFWGGMVACPLNVRWSLAELLYGLRDSDARVLMVGASFEALAVEVQIQLPDLQLVYLSDEVAPAGALRFDDLIEAAAPVEDLRVGGDDPALLLYTGGTTGAPKGVVISHANMASASLGVLAAGLGSGPTMLQVAPAFHMAGVQMLCSHIMHGGTSVVLPAFNPEAVLQAIGNEAITDTMLVPTMLQALIEHPRVVEYDLGSLERLYYGASPISEALLRRAMALMPNTDFIQGYGMTETCLTIMLPAADHGVSRRLGAAGLPLPTVELRIADADDDECARGVAGEILVRGPSVMRGYWRQPEASAQVLKNGWMHTGDVGYMDDEGYVYIVDRLKDMIVSGGENVFSVEVERALARYAGVAACAVIGIPDPRWGEAVHAIVVARAGCDLDASALRQHCQDLMAAYKCPRSFEFRESLPLSAAGKVLKKILREPYWQNETRGVS